MKHIIAFTLFILIVVLAIIHDHNNYLNSKLDVPEIDDIASVILMPASVGNVSNEDAIKINLNDPNQRIVIEEELYWLRKSKLIGIAKDQFISFGSNLTTVTITTKNGDVLVICDAIGAISTKIVGGSIMMKSISINDQVTIYNNGKAVRVVSPELKEWIENGWKDLRNNSKR